MPIYEYICEDCGKEFDAIRPLSKSEEPMDCKECNSPRTKRKLSLCYAHSDGRSVTTTTSSGGCGGCSGGSCSNCGH